jgi:hypothetical protein
MSFLQHAGFPAATDFLQHACISGALSESALAWSPFLQQAFPSSFLAQASDFLQLALSLQHFLSANIVVVANNANATNNIFFIFIYFYYLSKLLNF